MKVFAIRRVADGLWSNGENSPYRHKFVVADKARLFQTLIGLKRHVSQANQYMCHVLSTGTSLPHRYAGCEAVEFSLTETTATPLV